MSQQNDKHSGAVPTSSAKPIHELNLVGRKKMNIRGVVEVLSFDDRGAVIKTTDGELSIEGEGIKIGELDTACGLVTLDGRISAMIYAEEAPERKRGRFWRTLG